MGFEELVQTEENEPNFIPMTKLLFDVDLYPGIQDKILEDIFDPDIRKITIRATTRMGKSFTMAMAAILYAILHDNTRVGILAPTHDKARIIMNYIADLLSRNETFDSIVMVDTEGLTKLERLRKEVSKRRITFLNGSSIEIKSIDLTSRGMAAMGFAYHLTIVEETAEIDEESYSKIYRMLVESIDAKIVEIGNPWNLGHFHEHHHSDDWEKIHISWEDCVKCGRMTQEAVDDQRRELTDIEFKILFDADFPEQLEFAIFPNSAIEHCITQIKPEIFDKYHIGIDVARGGRDLSVITVIGESNGKFYYIEHVSLNKNDIMLIVCHAREIIDKYKDAYVTVDTVGLGAGVKDRLSELKYNVSGFVAGNTPRSDRYFNLKTEVVFKVAELAKDGKLLNLPPASKFILQLRSWTYEVRSDKKLKIIDPDKSPDEGDSLILSLSNSIYHEKPIFKGNPTYKREAIIKARERWKRR